VPTRTRILTRREVTPSDTAHHSLDEIARTPELVRAISPENARALMAQCAAVMAALATLQSCLCVRSEDPNATPNKLLTVAEAADRLSMSEDWVYRHAGNLPFTVRQGRALRFSSRGIDEYIRRREMK
jgi:excisionase family DNA binding protein